MQVFEAIQLMEDAEHTAMHHALEGYAADAAPVSKAEATADAAVPKTAKWWLPTLDSFNPAATPQVDTEETARLALLEEHSQWKCAAGASCAALADGTCINWHDERELKFARVRTRRCTARLLRRPALATDCACLPPAVLWPGRWLVLHT